MKIYEIWEYGYGNLRRFRYRAREPVEAAKKFMMRKVLGREGYVTFADNLLAKGQERILVCVKRDPEKKGTKQDPNYPEIYHFELDPDQNQWEID